MNHSFQIGPQTFFTLRSTVLDAEGEAASTPDVISAVFGMGVLLPALEAKVEGHVAGDVFTVELPPEQAFGRRRQEAIIEVDRSEFPEGVAPGDKFEAENADGGLLVLHVLDVQEEIVVLDTNHPLADQSITIDVEVVEVRPATPEEIDAAAEQMNEDQAYLSAEAPDVSPAALLKK